MKWGFILIEIFNLYVLFLFIRRKVYYLNNWRLTKVAIALFSFLVLLIIFNNQIKVLNQENVLLLCLSMAFVPLILVYLPQMPSRFYFHGHTDFLLVLHIHHAPSNFQAIVETFSSAYNTLSFAYHPNSISNIYS